MFSLRAAACLLMGLTLGWAQPLPFRPGLRLFGDDCGLPSTAVHDVIQDAKGQVWAGTQKGLARLEGNQFRPLPGRPDTLPTFITRMLATDDGLWFVSLIDGLHFMGPEVRKAWKEADGKPVGRITQLIRGPEGHILVVNALGKVYQVSGDRLVPPPWAPPAEVLSLAHTPQGWMAASKQGLWYQGPEGWRLDASLKGPVQRVLGYGNQVIVGLSRGAQIGRPGAWREVEGVKGENLHSLEPAPGLAGQAAVWMLSNNRAFCLEGEALNEIAIAAPGETLQFTAVRHTTSQGRTQIWITSLQGIYRFQTGGWNALPLDKGPGNAICFSMTRTPDGAIWFGDVGGNVFRYFQDRWEKWPLAPADSPFTVYALSPLPGSKGGVLALLSRGGLWRWEGRTWTFCGWGELPQGTSASSMALGTFKGDDGAWITSERGLWFWSLRRGIVQVAPTTRTLRWVLPDPTRPGQVLTGGLMDQVLRWDGTQLVRAAELPGCRFTTVAAWVPGQEGRTYRLGTFEQGLKTFTLEGRLQDHLCREATPVWPGDVILSLRHDAQGRAWVGTDGGLVRLGTDGHLDATYKRADGLPSNLCTNLSLLVEDPARYWTGTSRGVAFLPVRDERPAPLPAMRLLSASSDAGPLPPGGLLHHPASRIRFRFDLPLLHREEDIRYQTQLEGVGQPPGPWSPESTLDFPTLPSGNYRLVVRAMDGIGRVSAPWSFPFTVAPPIWRHPFMFAVYGLVILGAGIAGHRVRTAHLRQRNLQLNAAVQKATADLRQANERLYHLNDEKNRIIGVAAHDLRSPLSGILMYCELLQEDATPEQNESISHMRDIARSMTELLQGLLDINAIEANTVETPVLEVVDPLPILQDIVEMYRGKAQRKGIHLDLQAEATPPVLLDPKHVHRILDNFISNAIKYSPHDRHVWLRLRIRDTQVRFEVQDEGPGLSEEDLTRVFGIYARLSARPTGGEPSVGLGLSIVKKLAEDMGGQVGVDSLLGHGATFWMELPLRKG